MNLRRTVPVRSLFQSDFSLEYGLKTLLFEPRLDHRINHIALRAPKGFEVPVVAVIIHER